MEFGRKFTIVFSFFFWIASLTADPSYAIKEELLYLQPIFANDFIAGPVLNEQEPFRIQPGGPGKRNKFDYSQGLRFSVYYFPSTCWLDNFSFSCTYLPARHHRTMDLNAFLNALLESPVDCLFQEGLFDSQHALTYYAGDLLATFNVFKNPCTHFTWQAGIHTAYLSYQTTLRFSSPRLSFEPRIREKSETTGIGPYLGIQLDYTLLSCLSFKAKMGGGLLYSRAHARFYLQRICPSQPGSLNKFFPYWETKAGLAAAFDFSGNCIEFEIGYEYLSYPSYINRIQFPGIESRAPDTIFSKFDFQGPYASLTISF